MSDNSTKLKPFYPLSKIVLFILFSTCTFIIFLRYFQNADVVLEKCPVILTNYTPKQVVWTNNNKIFFLDESSTLFAGILSGCDISAKQVGTAITNEYSVLCEHTSRIAELEEKRDNILVKNLENNKEKSYSLNSENFPVYCDSDFLVLKEIHPENTQINKLLDLPSGQVNKIENQELSFTLIPLDSTHFLSFKESSKPGLHLSDKLILDEDEFGHWDLSKDKQDVFFTTTKDGKTILNKVSINNSKISYHRTLPTSVNAFLKLSPDKNKLATTDSEGFLTIIDLGK